MPVPKKKKSKARRDTRRSHDHLTPPSSVIECPNCGEATLLHHACASCGTYKGREVFQIKD